MKKLTVLALASLLLAAFSANATEASPNTPPYSISPATREIGLIVSPVASR